MKAILTIAAVLSLSAFALAENRIIDRVGAFGKGGNGVILSTATEEPAKAQTPEYQLKGKESEKRTLQEGNFVKHTGQVSVPEQQQ